MIRFILKRKRKNPCGLETANFEHIDIACYWLEEALTRGGMSETEYDHTELIGVKIIPDQSIEQGMNLKKRRKS
jgi:hypothetical protein